MGEDGKEENEVSGIFASNLGAKGCRRMHLLLLLIDEPRWALYTKNSSVGTFSSSIATTRGHYRIPQADRVGGGGVTFDTASHFHHTRTYNLLDALTCAADAALRRTRRVRVPVCTRTTLEANEFLPSPSPNSEECDRLPPPSLSLPSPYPRLLFEVNKCFKRLSPSTPRYTNGEVMVDVEGTFPSLSSIPVVPLT
ncbi:hypothetical protein BDQ12DRAFT_727329 [Crucibulum laeve]|uniref:Uncharacterized protein n=1 Tax=Crucibulum laeve TaxID=68775 RepID=A0A5C3LM29_9AGAR|nr:hypothetical protein BDQ12DRAFT_727329 [Crucibulum laeve]